MEAQPLAVLQAQADGRAQVDARAQVDVQASVPEVEVEAAAPVDGTGEVEFFGIPLEGAQDVVFVLDRSGSMSGRASGRIGAIGNGGAAARKIDVAREELVQALDRLPEGTRLNVIFFNRGLEGFAPEVVVLDATKRDELVAFVKETTPNGATALAPALRTAFLMNARRVVLLSDGLGNIGGDSADVLRDAREAMRGGVRIDTIGLGPDQDDLLLQTLAAESRGVYQDFR